MRRYYKSDVKIIERWSKYDVDVPFKFTYKGGSNGEFIASYDGVKYHNCFRNADNTLTVLLENHGLVGNVRVLREFFVPDTDCEDGTLHAADYNNIDLIFVDGITDDSDVVIDVILPYARGLKGDKGDSGDLSQMTPAQKDELVQDVVTLISKEIPTMQYVNDGDISTLQSSKTYTDSTIGNINAILETI